MPLFIDKTSVKMLAIRNFILYISKVQNYLLTSICKPKTCSMKRLCVFLACLVLVGVNLAQAQTVRITGTVTSSEDGMPIPGVSVIVKGTTNGAATNIDGKYELNAGADAQTLVFSSVGFKAQEVAIGGRAVIDVVLESESLQMEELVVTALGISRSKKSLVYSVQDVKGDALTSTKETNVVNSLSGKIAGIQVTSAGGSLGSSSRITIRGNNTFTGNTQPLFVVDGTPIVNYSSDVTGGAVTGGNAQDFGNSAMDIDPNSIESISVLKGGSAAAAYGMRAANGVIIITTKKGSQKKKGLGINFSHTTTLDRVTLLPKFQNEYGQGKYGDEYIYNHDKVLVDPDDRINQGDDIDWSTYQNYSTTGSFNYVDGNGNGIYDNEDVSWGPRLDIGLMIPQFNSPYNATTGYDATPWISQPNNVKDFFQTGVANEDAIDFNITTETSSTRLGLSNSTSKGVIPNTDLTRRNVSLASTLKLAKKFKVDVNGNYVNTKNDNIAGTSYNVNNVMQSLGNWFGRQVNMKALKDNWNSFDPFGQPYNWNASYHNNPYWTVNNNTTQRTRNRVFGNVAATYTITDWLNVMGRVGTDYQYEFRKHVEFDKSNGFKDGGYFSQRQYEISETNADLMLNFDKNITQDIRLDGTFGAAYMNYKNRFNFYDTRGLTVPNLFTITNAKANNIQTTFQEKESNSVYALANITYKWLTISGTFRNDWSSTLPKDAWSFKYYSIGANFIFTDAFKLGTDILSFGKIRASYAKTGTATDPYKLNATFGSQASAFSGVTLFGNSRTIPPKGLVNETTYASEIGTELRFVNNRFGVDATYFSKKSVDMIMDIEIPKSTGYNLQTINAGEIVNKGVELSLNAGIIKSANGFNWEVDINWSKIENKVNKLDSEGKLKTLQITSSWSALVNARPGSDYGVLTCTGFARDAEGRLIIDPSTGAPLADTKLRDFGSVVPKWMGGIRNTFSYKGLSLTTFIDARMGGKIFSLTKYFGIQAGVLEETTKNGIRENGAIVGENVFTEFGDAVLGQVDGSGTLVKDADGNYIGTGVKNDVTISAFDLYQGLFGIQEVALIDASYVKLREVSLSYNLPKSIVAKLGFIQSVNVGVFGKNLLLLYSDKSNTAGIDPETGTGANQNGLGIEINALPSVRSFGFKMNIGF